MLNLNQVMQWLRENSYVDVVDNTYQFTHLFFVDLVKINNEEQQVIPVANREIALSGNWPMAFMEFIREAKVPAKVESTKGDTYYVNKYSEPAMKQFRKMIEKEGIEYAILVRSTALYYASQNKFKKKIGNYILEGDWRTDYMLMKEMMSEAIASGDSKQLSDHIKNELEDGKPHTGYSIG